MTDGHWVDFWRSHAKTSSESDPQVQVLRTCGGQPIPLSLFQRIVQGLICQMELGPRHVVLDLCCGNGLITSAVAATSRRVVAVDVAPEFVTAARHLGKGNVLPLLADVRKVNFRAASFDRVLLFAGLQYLSHQDTLGLLQRLHHWLVEDGLVYIGDIPDASRRWRFFDTKERRDAYFAGLLVGNPIVGTWFEREWLVYAGLHSGFAQAQILEQDAELPFAHYRYDVLLRR